ncbi:MAG: hypothetical protein LBN08_02540 [Lactobacillales bacterium]|jgi:hypothetical protein|nr:hypothetical protein [Lactobacillales bacterium]
MGNSVDSVFGIYMAVLFAVQPVLWVLFPLFWKRDDGKKEAIFTKLPIIFKSVIIVFFVLITIIIFIFALRLLGDESIDIYSDDYRYIRTVRIQKYNLFPSEEEKKAREEVAKYKESETYEKIEREERYKHPEKREVFER